MRGAGADVALQKFLGLELAVRQVTRVVPLVMDARVPQGDGFRFVYTLPLRQDRLLVEDTYYSEDPTTDRNAIRARVLAYAADTLGAPAIDVVREEVGVLPLPLEHGGAPAIDRDGPIVAGFRGGYCHPTTGYSFPLAVRVALALTSGDGLGKLEKYARAIARQRRFAVLLNRLLFRATPPAARAGVLARFYTLPGGTIGRFYAMDTTLEDRARILCGKPPAGVSIAQALLASALP
jgi:lycopene beta-cyclase